MQRFILVFLLCLLTLFTLDVLNPVQQHVILPFTSAIADFSAWLMRLFDTQVVSERNIIRHGSGGPGIEIVAGCNGVEAILILVSAILAFPAPWKHKFVGIALGFLAIQALNLVRIVSLFYLHQCHSAWFEWFHLYLWQALIILDALIVWLVWVRYLPRTHALADAAAT